MKNQPTTLLSYEEFSLQEGVMSSLLKHASSFIKGALQGLVAPLKAVVTQIKTDWKDGVTAEKVRATLLKAISDTFGGLVTQVEKANSAGEVGDLLDKAQQAATDMTRVYTAALRGMTPVKANESADAQAQDQATDQVDEEGAKSIVGKVMDVFGKQLLALATSAKKNIQNAKDLAKFKASVVAAIQKSAKYAEDAVNKLDVAELAQMAKTKDPKGASGNQNMVKRRQQKYKQGEVVVYIRNNGEKDEAQIVEDLGDEVLLTGDKGTKFKKAKEDVVGRAGENGARKDEGEKADWGKIEEPDGVRRMLAKHAGGINDDQAKQILAVLRGEKNGEDKK